MLLFALLTFELSGMSAICGEPSVVEESCPTDESGECPPNCHQCNCCSLPTFTKPAPTASSLKPAFELSKWIFLAEMPVTPDPTAILHVPKILLS